MKDAGAFSYACFPGYPKGLASDFKAGKDDNVEKEVKEDDRVVESGREQVESPQPGEGHGTAGTPMGDDKGRNKDRSVGGWEVGFQSASFPTNSLPVV